MSPSMTIKAFQRAKDAELQNLTNEFIVRIAEFVGMMGQAGLQ